MFETNGITIGAGASGGPDAAAVNPSRDKLFDPKRPKDYVIKVATEGPNQERNTNRKERYTLLRTNVARSGHCILVNLFTRTRSNLSSSNVGVVGVDRHRVHTVFIIR